VLHAGNAKLFEKAAITPSEILENYVN
jgi:cation transport ATPase